MVTKKFQAYALQFKKVTIKKGDEFVKCSGVRVHKFIVTSKFPAEAIPFPEAMHVGKTPTWGKNACIQKIFHQF